MKFDLYEQLKKYNPLNDQEKENVEKFIQFLETDNCFSRSNLAGHITAGGFVGDGEGNILLNHHKKSGMWFQFGGHSDGNPNSLEVAKREILEEAGITQLELVSDGIFDVDVQVIPASEKKGEPEHYHYDVNFLFFVKDKKFKISNESTEIRWVTIDEAKKLVHPLDTGMRRMIDKYEKNCKKYIASKITKNL